MGSHEVHLARIDTIKAKEKAAAMVKAGTNRCPCGRKGTWQMAAGAEVHWRCDDCRAREERIKPPRQVPKPPITIGGLLESATPNWIWAQCARQHPYCGHRTAVTLVQFAIRWGMDASSDMIRRNLRCAVCGHTGVMLTVPSDDEERPFPVASRQAPPWLGGPLEPATTPGTGRPPPT